MYRRTIAFVAISLSASVLAQPGGGAAVAQQPDGRIPAAAKQGRNPRPNLTRPAAEMQASTAEMQAIQQSIGVIAKETDAYRQQIANLQNRVAALETRLREDSR